MCTGDFPYLGDRKKRFVWPPSLEGSTVMEGKLETGSLIVSIDFQPDMVQNLPGVKCLGLSMKEILDQAHGVGKTYPRCGWHHPPHGLVS